MKEFDRSERLQLLLGRRILSGGNAVVRDWGGYYCICNMMEASGCKGLWLW